MEFGRYASYAFQDFFEDDNFVNHIINPVADSGAFFEGLYTHFPEKKADIDSAIDFISNYRKQDTFYNETRQAELWAKIEAGIGQPTKRTPIISFTPILRATAAILIIGLGIFLFQLHRAQYFFSSFGEIKTVVMPDGTTVILNGNSSITYRQGWGKKSREVWLTGEAFFKVKHLNKDPANIQPGERFTVHCSDINIEVLGTTFNVVNRHGKTNVGLVTGKIKLTGTQKLTHTPVIMAPGDYVEYAPEKVLVKSKLIHPENLSGWSKRNFVFKNEKLKNILNTLEDTYGYQIEYKNEAAKEMEIEGEINVNGVSNLLETISTSLHIKIYQNNNQIIIN